MALQQRVVIGQGTEYKTIQGEGCCPPFHHTSVSGDGGGVGASDTPESLLMGIPSSSSSSFSSLTARVFPLLLCGHPECSHSRAGGRHAGINAAHCYTHAPTTPTPTAAVGGGQKGGHVTLEGGEHSGVGSSGRG